MALPPRFCYSLKEAALRWGCSPADIYGWAAAGHLDFMTSIPPVRAGAEIIAGLVILPAADLLRLFRRCGSGPDRIAVHRVRPPDREDWAYISEPAGGIEIEQADIIIPLDEAERFEQAYQLFGPRDVDLRGTTQRWDWDGFYIQLIQRVHEMGLPETQRELIDEMRGWFERRSETGDAPDDSTIRKRIAPIWKELRGRELRS